MSSSCGEVEVMPQVMVSSPYTPTKVVLRIMLRKHTYRPHATVRNCLYGQLTRFSYWAKGAIHE